jgi:dihydrofolate reductase
MTDSGRTKVSVFIATSVDGFIARPDGDVSWLHDGEQLEGEDYGYHQFMESVDTLVMGRNSFEKVLEFGDWPYEKPVIVLSRSLTKLPEQLRDRVKIDTSSPAELADKLAQEGIRHIYLDGGRVIQSFLRAGLVDDMVLTRIPVLLGQGLPLFGELSEDVNLRHVSTQSWHNGLVQSKYQVIGR